MSARLTATMLTVLKNLHEGWGPYAGCLTRAEYGGRGGTVRALVARRLIVRTGRGVALTDEGKAQALKLWGGQP